MKSSDLNNLTTSQKEHSNEGHDDLYSLLKEASGSRIRENQEKNQTDEIISAISLLNENLANLKLPDNDYLLKNWITPQEVMQKLYISERTLADWRKTEKIHYTAIGNKFFYSRQELETLLMNGYGKSKKNNGKQASG